MLLNAVDTAIKGGDAPPPSPVPNKVKTEAAAPARAGALDAGHARRQQRAAVADDGARRTSSERGHARRSASSASRPSPAAIRSTATRTRDVTPADFAQLFGPGGKIDQLFQQKLAAVRRHEHAAVAASEPVEGAPLGSDTGTLAAVPARRGDPRHLLPRGGNAPSLRLRVQAGRDGRVDHAVHPRRRRPDRALRRTGRRSRRACSGPGPRGSAQVRVQVSPPRPAATFGHGRSKGRGRCSACSTACSIEPARRARDASAPPSTSTAARRSSRSPRAACATRSGCASCTTSSARLGL